MFKVLGKASALLLGIGTFFIQTSTVSCTKEQIIRDTVIVNDTIVIRDTTISEMELIKRGINDSLWAHFAIVNNSLSDSSGKNRTLNLMGTAKLAEDRWGKAAGSISFDGSGSYAIIPEGKNFNAANFTIAFYAYISKTEGLIFGKQEYATANGATFNFGFDPVYDGDKLRFAITNNQNTICNAEANGSTKLLQNGSSSLNRWLHIAIIHESGTMKLYLNGELIESKNHGLGNLNFCNNAEWVLGSWWKNQPNYFNGNLDNIRIYTRALQEKEIKYLWKCD